MIKYNFFDSTFAAGFRPKAGFGSWLKSCWLKTAFVFASKTAFIIAIGFNNSFAQGQWQVVQDQLVNDPAGSESVEALETEVQSTETEALTNQTPDLQDRPFIQTKQPEILSAVVPLSTTPTLDPSILRNLDEQFQKVREAREIEDAFSPSLGETYFSYGLLLKDVGRLDEAREMFLDALHIKKINEGVYSIDQRPILKALFQVHYAQGNSQSFGDNLSRIIWLEKKERSIDDDFTFELAVQAGNYHIDQFLYDPSARESAIAHLDAASRYLRFATARHGNTPISEKLMPYGELALVSYLRKAYEYTPGSRPTFFDQQRTSGRNAFALQRQEFAISVASFNNGERYLKSYLVQARKHRNVEQVVQALLGLGDFNLLFEQTSIAKQYYGFAWVEAQKLEEGHALRTSFDRPVQLPAFNYAQQRLPIETKKESRYIPMNFKVDSFGKVNEIVGFAEDDENFDYFKKARRTLRRTKFRPVVSNGSVVPSELVKNDIRVFVKAVKPAESASEGSVSQETVPEESVAEEATEETPKSE